MKQTNFKCKLCGAFAERRGDCFRHANEPFEDGSGFCDRYGYPIDVVRANPHIGSSLRSLYEEFGEVSE